MIDSHILPPDTQAILLLCSRLEQKSNSYPQPLNILEYNTIARWLHQDKLTPADLLEPTLQKRLSDIKIDNLDSHRLVALLERGMMLSLAVEKWTSKGLWVIGRGEARYPQHLKKNLQLKAPPVIYGVGNADLLNKGGLAVVGSRDVDDEGIEYTKRVVEVCANQEMQVVSGGARGVDQVSMLSCLNLGGTVIGILADSLTKASVASKYRDAIKEGKLTLISTYHPDAGFSVGNAMGRNKYIYALADYALVISSSVGKGGTWAGAVEALENIKTIPVFVRAQGNIPKGNSAILQKGAIAFPEFPWHKSFNQLLPEYINNHELKTKTTTAINDDTEKQSSLLPLFNLDTLADKSQIQEAKPNIPKSKQDNINLENTQETENTTNVNTIAQSDNSSSLPKSIYDAVLPIILANLTTPKTHKSLAKDLDVKIGQMSAWLKIALAEGKVIKHKKPVTYEINSQKKKIK